MNNTGFLHDVCPNHTDASKWNRSELLHILELHKAYLMDEVVSKETDPVQIDKATEILLKELLSDFFINIPDMDLNITKTELNKDSGNSNVHSYVNEWLKYKNIKRTF